MQNVIEVDFTNSKILQESNEVDYPKYCLEKLINNWRFFTKQEIQKVLDWINYDKARKLDYSECWIIAFHEVLEQHRKRIKIKTKKLTLV